MIYQPNYHHRLSGLLRVVHNNSMPLGYDHLVNLVKGVVPYLFWYFPKFPYVLKGEVTEETLFVSLVSLKKVYILSTSICSCVIPVHTEANLALMSKRPSNFLTFQNNWIYLSM